MVVVDQEEIVKITADFFCRRHAGIEIKLVPVGEGREDTRQHGLLNLGGSAQLGAHAFFFRSDGSQIFRIIDDAVLHIPDFLIEITDFVVGANIQLNHILFCESTAIFGKFGSRFCQLLQR